MAASTNAEKTTKVRLFLISDTHCQIPSKNAPIFRTPLPRCDIFIHAGDMTFTGKLSEYQRTLSWIKTIDAELKIIIAGNHDLTLDEDFYAAGNNTRHTHPEFPHLYLSLFNSPEAEAAGIVYMTESTQTFTLKRKKVTFKVHASPYQPEFNNWAFAYPPSLDRWNPLPDNPELSAAGIPPVPEDTDILITHGPPETLHDEIALEGGRVGCPWLRKALERVRPRLHVFGHVHEGFGATRVEWNETGDGSASAEKQRRTLKPLGWVEGEELAKETGRCAAWQIDMSHTADEPLLGKGKETLVVNASLLTKTMKVAHGGVLLDMELPTTNV